jgi:hypothetical protein
MVLYAALIVIALGALVGSTVVYFAEAERTAAEVSLRRTQARAIAWSGVQAVMAELAAQRPDLLVGASPRVTPMWTDSVAESDGERVWMYRLRPIGADLIQAEAGRLCVNTATAEMLEAVGVPKAAAAAIVSRRASRPFGSTAELEHVAGMSSLLAASAVVPGAADPGASGVLPAAAATPGDSLADLGVSMSLADLLTVFSFDPDVQVGIGDRGSDVRGNLRINLNVPWSDRLGEAIERRWDKGVASAIKGMMERGDRFDSLGAMVRKMRSLRLPVDSWPEVLDAFTASPDPYRIGLVDLNTAPAGVLAAVPGIGPEAAAEIVARRALLDEAARRTVVWPVSEGIVPAREFEQAVDHLTMRCLQWRVIVEGGRARPGLADAGLGASGAGTAEEEMPLDDAVVLEAVIDVSSERPRVAYLRDITYLEVAAEMAAEQPMDEEAAPETARAGDETPEVSDGAGGHEMASKELENKDLETRELDFGDKPDGGRVEGAPEEAPVVRPATPAPEEGKDRRIGRWSSGQGGPR